MKFFVVVIACSFLLIACSEKKESTGGLSPQDALSSFRLPEGFSIELVASEPLIADPVAMEIDENGNFYVVEMHGYPLDTTGSGKIKLLTDTNGDGRPDKSTVFADHLRLPTGIMRWKKGVLVVDVPDLLYLEDTNNDGKADIIKKVLTGMALTNPQHIANTPLYGLDNWIYLAHMGIVTPKVSMMFNDSGSLVRFADNPQASTLPRNADGRNIRLKPDTHQLEMLSGETQYGQSFDNWGHHFCVENAEHIFQEVIAARYLQRNPNLLLADASDYISDHGEACAVYPITTNPENQLLTDRGVITSACGITWYNGGLFPDSFNTVTFVCEPASNLIHADRLKERGAAFTASSLYHQKEFLASTDSWFRPVQMYIGPDGALYVIDYYRQIIEHPEWLSDEVIKSGALYNGSKQGRIYRIAPKGTAAMKWCNNLSLGKAGVNELVQALSSNNIWWRRQAQRLLVDKMDTTAVTKLKSLIALPSTSPTAMVHALWTLEGLHALDESSLLMALKNNEAGVRENAFQLAELHLNEFSAVQQMLPSLWNDPSAKVRFQLLCTLGNVPGEESAAAQQKILLHDIEDKWVQTAALASAKGEEWTLLEKTLPALSRSPSEGKQLFFSNSATLIGLSQNKAAIDNVFKTATSNNIPGNAWWQSALLQGLTVAAKIKSLPLTATEPLLSKFDKGTPPLVRSAAIDLLLALRTENTRIDNNKLQQARQVAADKNEDAAYRADAMKLLALDATADHFIVAENIITGNEPEAVQQAAVKTYQQSNAGEAAAYLIGKWQSLPQRIKEATMPVLFSSSQNMSLLLNAIEKKQIATTDISWPRKVELMNNDDEGIRSRSRKLLAGEIQSREEAYKQYLSALSLKADTGKGRAVFTQVCGSCHQYEGKYGNRFGPDLGTVRNREKASVMADILDPNRSIAVKYDLWTVNLKDGSKRSGILQGETPAAITLAQASGQPVTISRADIKSMETAGVSAMPVGLESSLTKEQMAHLLAFITGKQ